MPDFRHPFRLSLIGLLVCTFMANAALAQRGDDERRKQQEQAERQRREADERARQHRHQDEREKEQRAKAERERAQHEAAQRERAQQEKALRERAQHEAAQRERAQQEAAQRERAQHEAAQRERAQQDKVQRERAQHEQAEREHKLREWAQQNKDSRERAEREKAHREKVAREKERHERAERDRDRREDAHRERAERERYEREQDRRLQLEREQALYQRLQRDQSERDRAERERDAARVLEWQARRERERWESELDRRSRDAMSLAVTLPTQRVGCDISRRLGHLPADDRRWQRPGRDYVYVGGDWLPVPPARRRVFRDISVLRPFGHLYPGFGRYRSDAEAYRWLGLTPLTLPILAFLDEPQQRAAEDAQIAATQAAIGEPIPWRAGNASGSVVATAEGTAPGGEPCREILQTVSTAGRSEQARGTAIQRPDGAWQIVGG